MKQCPFCGSYRADVAYMFSADGSGKIWWWFCYDCGATGPKAGSAQAAIELSERRPLEDFISQTNDNLRLEIQKLERDVRYRDAVIQVGNVEIERLVKERERLIEISSRAKEALAVAENVALAVDKMKRGDFPDWKPVSRALAAWRKFKTKD